MCLKTGGWAITQPPVLFAKPFLPIEDRHRIIDDGVLVVTLLFVIIDARIHAIDESATGDEFRREGFAAIEIDDEFIV